jgi:hypothetical protein
MGLNVIKCVSMNALSTHLQKRLTSMLGKVECRITDGRIIGTLLYYQNIPN